MRAALLFVLLASTPALASETKTPSGAVEATASAAATPEVKAEKKICKRIAASESRMAAKRVCMTAAEWKRQAEADR